MGASERADRNLEEAIDWLLAARAAPDDALVQAGLRAWLDADPDHGRAWAQAQRSWHLVGAVSPVHLDGTGDVPRRAGSGRRRRLALAAAVAVFAALFAAAAPDLWLRWQADAVTDVAEGRRLQLADGTVVQLAPRSAFSTAYDAAVRRVRLHDGEAYLDVAHGNARPFVLQAGDLTVTVTGTSFSVARHDDVTTVSVRSGSVAVSGTGRAVDLELTAGDRAVFDPARPAAVVERIDPGNVAAWRDGRLFVEDASVSDVAEVLRRYRAGWIVVDGDVARRRITGLYDLRDPVRALRAAVQPAGGTVLEITPLLLVVRGP